MQNHYCLTIITTYIIIIIIIITYIIIIFCLSLLLKSHLHQAGKLLD